MNKTHIQTMLETAMMAVFAFILSFIPIKTTNFDIAVGIIPIILLSLKRGGIPGATAGFLWGLLDIIAGKAIILTPWQGFIEYIIAFAFAGLAGLWQSILKQSSHPNTIIVLATITGVSARYFWHFIAGGIFWQSFAPATINPWLFSLVANGASAIATIALSSCILIFLYRYAKYLFH